MKISELLKKINERFPTYSDKRRAIDNLFNKYNELHICNLDLALILLSIMFHFNDTDVRDFFLERKELVQCIIDSSYVQYFAPEQFLNDVVTVDDEQRSQEIATSVIENINLLRISHGGIDAIDNHELINPIDINQLGVNKSNLVNSNNNVQIQIRGNNVYSFALSQTKFNVLNDIIIINYGNEEIRNARLVIISDPNYIEFSDIEVALLNPHQPISVSEFNVTPHLEDLVHLSEKTIGSITVKLFVEDIEIVSVTQQIEYFSFDTFFEHVINGSTALFVTPNDIAVKNIISLVGQELQKLTGSPSIDGYQSGSKENVVNQLKALYNTLFEQGIAYINPPASFEGFGQKIRIPHDVLIYKQGTCLDLAILFAACIECMGMNPFVTLISGHAFIGAFLVDRKFPTAVYYDASRILEMSSSQYEKEIILFECTSIISGSKCSFEEACAIGNQHILNAITNPTTGEADSNFEVIDISRARTNGFLPLPIGYDDVSRIAVDYEVAKQNKIKLVTKSYDYKGDKIDLSEAELNKFDIWEKKLLDLSNRNQLINYKITGRGLQLFYYDLNDLFNSFKNNGKKYVVSPSALCDNNIFELPEATVESYKELSYDFQNGKIGLIIRSNIQRTSLKFFEKERKKSFEETGSNVFYLALGFIRYFENSKSTTPHYAPIILVPIDLIKNSKECYSICGREEAPFLNISIFEFFHQEYGMNFDDLLTMDLFNEEIVNVDSIINTVSEKIGVLSRASIVRTAVINIFNYSKAVMWSDIKFRREELLKNKIIKSIINKKFIYEEGDEIATSIDDDDNDPTDLAIPLPADSSQIIAIRDCSQGKSFILQGPPGTGKSQTITNMIVNAIYNGKTVLFVAEKMAALDVVRNRLNQLCLGKFALEAHSTKADKVSLMSQFEERIALSHTFFSNEEYLDIANKIKEERKELNRVINLLHKKNKYFLSFYDAFVNYLDFDESIQAIELQDNYVTNLDNLKFNESSRLCDKLYSQIVTNGGYLSNPFLLYRNENYIPSVSKGELKPILYDYGQKLTEFLNSLNSFCSINGISIDDNPLKCSLLIELLINDEVANQTMINLIDIDFDSIDSYIENICVKGELFRNNIQQLRNNYTDGILDIDIDKMLNDFELFNNESFIKKNIGFGKITKIINKYSITPKPCTKSNLRKSLLLIRYERLRI